MTLVTHDGYGYACASYQMTWVARIAVSGRGLASPRARPRLVLSLDDDQHRLNGAGTLWVSESGQKRREGVHIFH